MTATMTRTATGQRPAGVFLTVGVLTFLGFSALFGGLAMIFGVGAAPPSSWLAHIPLVHSWVVPGSVLAVGFGVGSLVTAYGVVRRVRWRWLGGVERRTGRHWSWLATIVLGVGQLVWITLELFWLPSLSVLQGVYGAVGAALVLLPTLPPVRRDLAVRR